MRILGVDPGTLRTGTGIIDAEKSEIRLVAFKTITLSAKKDLPARLYEIFEELVKLIQEFKPEVVALENVFFGVDPKAMVKIGEARSCAMLAAAKFGLPVREYAPGRVKQSVTGHGLATKPQIQKMVGQLLKIKEPLPPDSADALAVALCHWHMKDAGPRAQSSRKGSSRWTEDDLDRLKQETLLRK